MTSAHRRVIGAHRIAYIPDCEIPDCECSHDDSLRSLRRHLRCKKQQKKQVSDRASAKRTAMSGKTFVLMANAGSQNGFFASYICSKNQAELQRRDSRPTAMMRRHDQMAPRDRNCNDTALLERSSAARTVVRTAQRRIKVALRGRSAISVPTATRVRPCEPSRSDEAGSERAPLRPRHVERMIDRR